MTVAYPNIANACLLIALDNGGINRSRSQRSQAKDFSRFIAAQAAPLEEIDAWLGGLSRDELEVVCCGEQDEVRAALANAPAFTDQLLNDYFDQVC